MQKIQFRCQVCGGEGWIQGIPDGKSVEDIQKSLQKKSGFHCFIGNHVELNSADKYWILKPETLQVDKNPVTDEQWLSQLRLKVGQVWTIEELLMEFEVIEFVYGLCNVKQKSTGQMGYIDFTHSPSGKRYYFGFNE